MNELFKVVSSIINWCIDNNNLVAWVFAALAGSVYKIYAKRVHDQAAIDDLKFIVHKAKDYAHVVNGNDNIPLNDVKSAIISGVREAVVAFNANTKTRQINVTDQQISHAADIAIDFYNQYFGGFSQAKATTVDDEDIAKAVQPEAPTSVATVSNTSVASAAPSLEASNFDANQIVETIKSQVTEQVRQALIERGDK